MKILYHHDADGYCAGYWAYKKFADQNPEMIMADYGMSMSWMNRVEPDEKIIIVDYSLDVIDMEKLLKITKDVIWIDHHASSIAKYKDFKHEIPGLRVDGMAACMLTYLYFNKLRKNSKTDLESLREKAAEAPLFTRMIADHDAWIFEFGDVTKYWKLGFDCFGHVDPTDTKFWDSLFIEENVEEIVNNGAVIETFRDAMAEKITKDNAYVANVKGYNILVLNNCMSGSEWFGEKFRDKDYDCVCKWHYNGKTKQYNYSFYSTKPDINCAHVARSVAESSPHKVISCGGHRGAAGLVHHELLLH